MRAIERYRYAQAPYVSSGPRHMLQVLAGLEYDHTEDFLVLKVEILDCGSGERKRHQQRLSARHIVESGYVDTVLAYFARSIKEGNPEPSR